VVDQGDKPKSEQEQVSQKEELLEHGEQKKGDSGYSNGVQDEEGEEVSFGGDFIIEGIELENNNPMKQTNFGIGQRQLHGEAQGQLGRGRLRVVVNPSL
tara:strand:+ start:113 stop:409 length:297 start_codon:yes stop_codon:yes gene_type:complete